METRGAEGPPEVEPSAEAEHEPTVTFVPADPHERLTAGQAQLPGVSGYALVVERGPRAGMAWILDEGTTRIGRHPDEDIILDDITVSRQHVRMHVDGEQLELEDAGSTNGTYVNGTRTDRIVVNAGDEIIIGKYHMVVAKGDE